MFKIKKANLKICKYSLKSHLNSLNFNMPSTRQQSEYKSINNFRSLFQIINKKIVKLVRFIILKNLIYFLSKREKLEPKLKKHQSKVFI